MEITKEQGVELFKNTLKEILSLNDRSRLFMEQGVCGVCANEKIKIGLLGYPSPEEKYFIQIIFNDFIEYKKIELIKEEFDNLSSLYFETDAEIFSKDKKDIIKTREQELERMIS